MIKGLFMLILLVQSPDGNVSQSVIDYNLTAEDCYSQEFFTPTKYDEEGHILAFEATKCVVQVQEAATTLPLPSSSVS